MVFYIIVEIYDFIDIIYLLCFYEKKVYDIDSNC